MTELIQVKVQKDHLDKVSRSPVLSALVELIWNGFDADANTVRVNVNRDEIGISSIEVMDDGHGIGSDKARQLFSSLGGSWKGTKKISPSGRFLHGKEGQGRFKAFAIGRVVEWCSHYKSGDRVCGLKIVGKAEDKGMFEVHNLKINNTDRIGTRVTIFEPHKEFSSLSQERMLDYFSSIFAVYLQTYSNLKLYINDDLLEVQDRIESCVVIPMSPIIDEQGEHETKLKIIEWNFQIDNGFHFCDNNEFSLLEHSGRIRGGGDFNYTAYLISSYIGDMHSKNTLATYELDGSLVSSFDEAKKLIRQHFTHRRLERSNNIIQQWKRDNIYPYKEDPASKVEEAERQVFDIVALNLSKEVPDFEKMSSKLKKFNFQLLSQAVKTESSDLYLILTEIFELSKNKQEEFAGLLKETTLSSIISASKIISDRLKFISGLEEMLFNPDFKKVFKERSQLHKILAENTWVFGDQFSLTVNDQSLSQVLKIHLSKKGLVGNIDSKVTRLDGRTGIVDLMLSRIIPRNHCNEREHLIVELKAPNVKLGQKEINQIESYAFAIAADERFSGIDTKWNFILISNELDEFAKRRAKQDKKDDGVIYSADNIEIKIKTWSELIQECKHRLKFVQDKLDVNIDCSDGLQYLQETYSEYTRGIKTEEIDQEAIK